MARTDAIVLGAGIVGTAIALHLAKRGLSVALVDRRGPGEETSYGNAASSKGTRSFHRFFHAACRRWRGSRLSARPRRTTISPFCRRSRRGSWPTAPVAAERLAETARVMRPLFARAVGEHEALMAEAGAGAPHAQDRLAEALSQDASFAATAREREVARISAFRSACSIRTAPARSSPRSARYSGTRSTGRARPASPIRSRSRAPMRPASPRSAAVTIEGDARSLHRNGARWRIDTEGGSVDATDAVVALGPWSPDLLAPLGNQAADGGEARLSPAFSCAGQCRAGAAGARCRRGLLPGADGQGHPHHHGAESPIATRRRPRSSSIA